MAIFVDRDVENSADAGMYDAGCNKPSERPSGGGGKDYAFDAGRQRKRETGRKKLIRGISAFPSERKRVTVDKRKSTIKRSVNRS